MSYPEMMAADRRLVILRLLAQTSDYTSNSSVLQMGLEQFGHSVSRDQLHTELSWLAEQGLLSVSEVATVRIAQLTRRGLDVSAGRSQVPGVQRPGPGR